MNKILDGKKLANKLNLKLKADIEFLEEKTGIRPKLATILIGEDPASKVYVNIKHRTCVEVGIDSMMVNLSTDISKKELLDNIKKLNDDNSVHGILLQLPLPDILSKYTSNFIESIDPKKDVDGFHPINRGKLFDYNEELAACTPKGIITLLENYNINLKGKNVVVVNRSILVGKPLIFMLLKRNATVTVCHTSTIDIDEHMRRADILIIAIGRPKYITKDKIKEGAIIIDVGTNRVDGKLCGDVDFEDVLSKCSKITPSPGGVGPMTVSSLMQNTLNAYENQLNNEELN
ncbi:MAG: bifunctional methylenetetrahydrofolate dehydrogenase/methenyltetrahydrofolate cyclohydrolase FolD [Candidatus Lokiarchaeota archaeon]|nr:bifunctional methylenetetrahydrofolate dehydrogenase/methenyltetrahydrofolate cyclohydrolase FolD [Candidatus Lokiarchaeota archaeon]